MRMPVFITDLKQMDIIVDDLDIDFDEYEVI